MTMPATTTITLTWVDGVQTSSATWAGLMQEIQRLPWHKKLRMQDLYNALAHRAWTWAGVDVDPAQAPEPFLRQLADDAGLFTITITNGAAR